jgi:hypothetical protein
VLPLGHQNPFSNKICSIVQQNSLCTNKTIFPKWYDLACFNVDWYKNEDFCLVHLALQPLMTCQCLCCMLGVIIIG